MSNLSLGSSAWSWSDSMVEGKFDMTNNGTACTLRTLHTLHTTLHRANCPLYTLHTYTTAHSEHIRHIRLLQTESYTAQPVCTLHYKQFSQPYTLSKKILTSTNYMISMRCSIVQCIALQFADSFDMSHKAQCSHD